MRPAILIRLASFLSIALILGGAGCNPDAYSLYVLEHYGSVNGEMVEIDGESFAVLDKTEEGRLLVAHTTNFYPIEEWQRVAVIFLDRSGKDCVVEKYKEITPRQIEFFYACA